MSPPGQESIRMINELDSVELTEDEKMFGVELSEEEEMVSWLEGLL